MLFVFLAVSMLCPNDTLAGFAKATKTGPAAKRYWRPLNSKRSLPVLKWTSVFFEFQFFFADIWTRGQEAFYDTCAACALSVIHLKRASDTQNHH